MSSKKVLLGVLGGIAAGALLGILFAPKKGSDTRKKISRKSEDITDNIKEHFNNVIDSVSEKFDKIKSEVSEFKEYIKVKSDIADKNVKKATA